MKRQSSQFLGRNCSQSYDNKELIKKHDVLMTVSAWESLEATLSVLPAASRRRSAASLWWSDVLIKFWTWREIASSNFVVWFFAANFFSPDFFDAAAVAPSPLSSLLRPFIWIISCKVGTVSGVEGSMSSTSGSVQACGYSGWFSKLELIFLTLG